MKRIVILLSAIGFQLSVFGQGPLTPPGAPAPTMKSLAQVEPRTPITNLPFTISQPGSYYVTTNLTGNPGGITIAANGVTLDLMGFELVGGTGDGILVTFVSTPRSNIVVRNGTVRNWTGNGVDTSAAFGQIESLRASGNGAIGIRLGEGFVRDCTAQSNTGDGIHGGSRGRVFHCTAHDNGSNGITGGFGSMVSSCTVINNGGDGIKVSQLSRVRDCFAAQNVGDGIEVSSSCYVHDNTCSSTSIGGGAGIHTTGGGNRIDGNHVVSSNVGIRTDAGDVIIRNSVGGNPRFNLSFDSIIGPTNNLVGPGNVITNQNPWANF